MSRGTELVVESFLVIDTRRISFNSYVTIHSEVALFLMSLCLIYSIYQSPSLSIARVSPPRSALILSGSAGPRTLVRAIQRSQAGTAPFLELPI